ncbi:MAG: branched-chain amino acid ABC transporter substrate-binding protein [Beijerinckiaceae bacterium]|jgi:branched-chain amino acid transport system substrate-binding protein
MDALRGAMRYALFLAILFLAPAPAFAQLRIGIAGPLSGPDAVFGQQIRDGVLQAIADINASGGILGQRAVPVLGDDQGNPQRATDTASKFARDKIPVVIGPFSSSAALPASVIYGGAGILEIIPAATSPRLTEQGIGTLFRLSGRDDQQSQVAARYILDHHLTKIAILHDRTAGGKALADALRAALKASGVTEVLYDGIDKGAKDLGPLTARVIASGAELAFWGGTQTEAGLLARQLHGSGAHVTLMGGTGMASDEFATLAGAGAEGTLMVFPPDPRERPEAAALLQSLSAKGIDPGAYSFYAYAAVEILRQAAGAAKSLDPATLAGTIHSGMVFKTVLGPLSFDAKGDRTAPDYDIFVWRKGRNGRMSYENAGRS